MDLEIIILSEINQKEEDKYYIIPSYMWNLKNNINVLIYKTEINSQRKKNYVYQRGSREG